MGRRSVQDLWTSARQNPREALEADLSVAGVGLVVVFFGSIVAAGGIYGRNNPNPTTPHPLLGTVIFFIGAAIVLFGLILAVGNIVLRLKAHLRRERSH